jgi:hypothetical protein
MDLSGMRPMPDKNSEYQGNPDLITTQQGRVGFNDAGRVFNRDTRANGLAVAATPDTTGNKPLLTSLQAALALRRPVSWLIKRVLQRGMLYAMTAMTNAGKTALAIHLALLVGGDRPGIPMLGPHRVKRGKVIYFVLENDQDILNRFHAAKIHYKINDISDIKILTAINLKTDLPRLKAEAASFGDIALVIIDTSSVAFASAEFKEENDSVEMTQWAELQRELTRLPGFPAVVALCHPIKRPENQEQLLPRGGSGYNNTIDANLTIWRTDDGTLEFSHLKIRGLGFETIKFGLEEIEDESFRDDDGDMTGYLVAVERTDADQASAARKGKETEDRIMAVLIEDGAMRNQQIAARTGIDKATVSRAMKRLLALKFCAAGREEGSFIITKAGKASMGAGSD